jgi:hypothetical protein
MNTYKLSIPLHMNMDYVRLIMEKWQETEALTLTKDTLFVEVVDDQDPNSLASQLDNLWCSKSPDGSVGFVDFLQTFGRGGPAYLTADDRTAQGLIDQAAANGLTKTELLAAVQALYGDDEEVTDFPKLMTPPWQLIREREARCGSN